MSLSVIRRFRHGEASLLLVVFGVMVNRWIGASVRVVRSVVRRVLIAFRVDHISLCITRSNFCFESEIRYPEIKGSRDQGRLSAV
jgi:hypothetical protein